MDKEWMVKLVKAMQAGDQNAAGQLYEACYQDIYYFILKTVKEKELAEDLTQDTFMKIMENISQLQEPEAFVGWSRQIAYHGCTAYFRKHKELLADENEDGGTVFDTITEENAEFIPHEALDREDLKKTILAMIDSLPQEQRSALILRYYEELPVSQIAKIQNVSEGTVKSRLNYGRSAVRKSVEAYEKKNGVKLHSFAILPLLLWLFRRQKAAKTAHTLAAKLGKTSGGSSHGSSGFRGAGKVASKGFFASVGAKILAGVLAVAVVVGAVFAVVRLTGDPDAGEEDETADGVYGGEHHGGENSADGSVPEGMVEIWLPVSSSGKSATYDRNGNVLELNSHNHYSFTYNAQGQVEMIEEYKKDGTLDARFTYTYDSRGNRTGATLVEPDYEPSHYTWEYDGAGNMIRYTSPYVVVNYKYENNRQVEEEVIRGGKHESTTYYTYNAEGLLIREECDKVDRDDSDTTTRYTYDGNNNLTEIVVSNESRIQSRARYTYEDGRLVAYEKKNSQLNGRYVLDGYGNVIEIRDFDTDMVKFQFTYERFVVTPERAEQLQEMLTYDDAIHFWLNGAITGV